LGSVLTTEGVWRESAPGVKFKILYHDRHADLLTTLVKMEPGAKIPAHMHSRAEQCLIVEGDLRQGGLVYGPGDFTYAEGGSVDEEISTVHGNVLLIIAPPEKGEIRL
jgi:anti-sigma factor ChrR (cupin superfamily)